MFKSDIEYSEPVSIHFVNLNEQKGGSATSEGSISSLEKDFIEVYNEANAYRKQVLDAQKSEELVTDAASSMKGGHYSSPAFSHGASPAFSPMQGGYGVKIEMSDDVYTMYGGKRQGPAVGKTFFKMIPLIKKALGEEKAKKIKQPEYLGLVAKIYGAVKEILYPKYKEITDEARKTKINDELEKTALNIAESSLVHKLVEARDNRDKVTDLVRGFLKK